MRQINSKEKIAVVCAVVAAALLFSVGRWYWFIADLSDAPQEVSLEEGMDSDGAGDNF